MKAAKFFRMRIATDARILTLIMLPVFFSVLILGSGYPAYAQGRDRGPHATGFIFPPLEEHCVQQSSVCSVGVSPTREGARTL